jgi:hypothetical protein
LDSKRIPTTLRGGREKGDDLSCQRAVMWIKGRFENNWLLDPDPLFCRIRSRIKTLPIYERFEEISENKVSSTFTY